MQLYRNMIGVLIRRRRCVPRITQGGHHVMEKVEVGVIAYKLSSAKDCSQQLETRKRKGRILP